METPNDKIIRGFNQLVLEHPDSPMAQSAYMNKGIPGDELGIEKWFIYIQKYFIVRPSDLFIDIGCGSGLFLKRFRTLTSHLYGVDPAEAVIKTTQLQCPDAIIRIGNVFDAGFNNIEFDRIFCNSVFLYLNDLKDAKRAIEHFFAISSKDAKIWLGDIPMPNPLLCDKNYKRISKTNGWSLQHYPTQFFYEICEPKGFKCKSFYQELQKESAAYRYDVLIEKI